ncbi:MAG: XRE family transcriptional regulator [Candidatus Melainabacteria bacterium]|nr:XRE family transcriptional regulator [Candidatus Melainabacteria bacterium]
MTAALDISPQELGERLKLARETAKITQADAASAIGAARTTLVAIEKGDRRVKIQELQELANLYCTSVNKLLRQEALHIDLVPRFRRLSDTNDPHIDEAVRLMNDLVAAEIELENLLGIKHPTNYPLERFLKSGDVVAEAEEHANELREFLGLGSAPVADIFTLIEMGLGIRLYQRRLSSSSKVSGLFAYDPAVGAAILLNANHPWERRVQTASHELGHFYGTRRMPEVLEINERFVSREEKYANTFGRCFVTPRIVVTKKFQELTAGSSRLTRRHIILLAHYFGVSIEAMVRRLEELELARNGTWEWFKRNGGITREDIFAVIGSASERQDSGKEDADRPLSLRMGTMAYEAWKKELLSEGQLAALLKLGRIELRSFLYSMDNGEGEADDLFKLPY